MNRITLDASLCDRLSSLPSPIELCDVAGNTVGFFTPATPAFYASLASPNSPAELQQREQLGGGRPLAEIVAELEERIGKPGE